MQEDRAIELRNVGKRFGTIQVLSDLNLAVRAGETLVVYGPSGSGKTTLLRLIAGFEHPDSGEIVIDSVCVSDSKHLAPPHTRGVGFVFQDLALWPHLTALQNVIFSLGNSRLQTAERRSRAMAILEQLRLGAMAHKYPDQLSGGEKQRVAIARAVVAAPRILCLDEPLSDLDGELRSELQQFILDFKRTAGSTVIYVSHYPEEATRIADRIALLERGRIVRIKDSRAETLR